MSVVRGVNFGSTDSAGTIPLAASRGPVFLEGRLVLSLSFEGIEVETGQVIDYMLCCCACAIPDDRPCDEFADFFESCQPLEGYRLWDDMRDEYVSDLALLRYESADEVVRDAQSPRMVWHGSLDLAAEVISEPDLDDDAFERNQAHGLRWKCVWRRQECV